MLTINDLTERLETVVAIKPPDHDDWQWLTFDRKATEEILRARDAGAVITTVKRRESLAVETAKLAAQCQRISANIDRSKMLMVRLGQVEEMGAAMTELRRMTEQAEALGLGAALTILREAADREAASQGYALLAARVAL